jgi:CTP:molybdopterin cytidylyltransferase MocA
MQPTLLILAAGMGSRYGGLKQLDGLGPNGETIMDYSVFDAVRSGFGKVVFVIRESFESDFRKKILKKYEHMVPVETVYQELDKLPAGFSLPPHREKPWGTNHALMMGADRIHEPFAVVNADDFYGRAGYEALAAFLQSVNGKQNHYAMVGYRVSNTLSESGTVARGVCATDAEGYLTSVVERTSIRRDVDGQIKYNDVDGRPVILAENTPVSMNMWGFTPEYFHHSDQQFVDFLQANAQNPKAEFYIPTVVNQLIVERRARVKVLDTPSRWFGVTYQDDRPAVVANIQELIRQGEYPDHLFTNNTF